MRVIITGAMGHIGSALTRSILGKKEQYGLEKIILVDNFSTQRFCSRFGLDDSGLVELIEADVTDYDLASLLTAGDYVVHLAAVTDAAGSFNNPTHVEQNNFGATKSVAEAIAKKNAKLIHISSTSVYGTAKSVVDENCSEAELAPQSPYAETKLREEKFIQQLHLDTGLTYQICRFGTIYGYSVGMRFHTAVNKFCWQASLKKPITVWETAYDQKRPYLSLIDACRFLELTMTAGLIKNDIINVLTANHTVRDIVEVIKSYVPDLQLEFVSSRIMNQLSYEVSNIKMLGRGVEPIGDLHNAIGVTLKQLGCRF